jgi:hypothetical protein
MEEEASVRHHFVVGRLRDIVIKPVGADQQISGTQVMFALEHHGCFEARG